MSPLQKHQQWGLLEKISDGDDKSEPNLGMDAMETEEVKFESDDKIDRGSHGEAPRIKSAATQMNPNQPG